MQWTFLKNIISIKKHVLLFDNATTHQKQVDDTFSATKMPKFTPKDRKNWGVATNVMDDDGKLMYGPNGKILKKKVPMADATFCSWLATAFVLSHRPSMSRNI